MKLTTTSLLEVVPLVFLLAKIISSTNFPCPGGGFYPDPTSCNSFYRCVDKTSYKYLCPSGTRYDPELSICNHEALTPSCHLETQADPTHSTTELRPTTRPTTRPTSRPTNIPTKRPTSRPTPSQTTIRPKTTEVSDRTTTQSVHSISVFPPALSTPIPAKNPPSTSVSPALTPISLAPPRNYSVSPTSLFSCPQPDYYQEETTCEQFYTCREIATGVLAAERIFRCPDRYRFNIQKRLCLPAEQVECLQNSSEQFLFYTVLNAMVVKLQENQLDKFFSSRLQLPLSRPKTDINPKVTLFGDNANPYPWIVFQSAIH